MEKLDREFPPYPLTRYTTGATDADGAFGREHPDAAAPKEVLRYLRVKFGDNDFGLPVENALKRIWADVYRNNAHLIDPVWRGHDHEFISLSEMFYALHKVGALDPMIARAVDCENHYSEVESATRGLHSQRFPWDDKIVSKSFKSITDTYLSTDLSFHVEMSKEWANGEEAWLDLETGKVESR